MNYNYNDGNVESKRRCVSQQTAEDVRRRCSELQTVHNQLNERINELQSFRDQPMLNLSNFTGLTLSNFSIEERGTEKEYSAWCRGEFRLAVTVELKTEKISKVDLQMAAESAFREIEDDLDRLCLKLCPHIVMMTLHQYAQMSIFRSKVLNQLLKPKAAFFRWYDPVTVKDSTKASDVCTVRAYDNSRKVIMEINWMFLWRDCNQALTHKFKILQKGSHSMVEEFLNTIENKSFLYFEQGKLWEEWEKLSNGVANNCQTRW